jgi:aminoglycoside phosphotransferase (APT) family kinase protein
MTSYEDRQFGFPKDDPAAANAFVEAAIGTNEFEIELHSSQGYRSHTYMCTSSAERYILRHGFDTIGMEKDRYAGEYFSSDDLVVPRVLSIQAQDDKSAFCLSECIPGEVLDEDLLNTPGTDLNVSFNEALQTLHTTDVSDSKWFGFAKGNGSGTLPKWLFDLGAQRKASELYWGRFAREHTSIDKARFKDITAMKRVLAGFCITERMLYHGDLKHDNLLAQGGQITGVIDWARYGYGDPAHDLGMVHVRYPGAVDLAQHVEAIKLSEKGLQERVVYYALSECSVALGFYGRQGNEQKFAETEQRFVEIADEADLLVA